MNIAVDAFPLAVATPSGIPIYFKNIFQSLLNHDKENKYSLYCKNPFEFSPSRNLTMRFGSGTTKNSSTYGNTLWLFTQGVSMMKKDKVDIFWGTRQMLPPYLPGNIKKVLTVYDLVWHYFPETMDGYNRLVAKLIFKKSIRRAEHIITISKATAAALIDVLGIPEENISIIYPAADGYRPLDRELSAGYISKKYKTDNKYMLTVSTVEPRKNLNTLLHAVAGLKNEGVQLLIAGASGWKTSSVYNEYEKLGFSEKEVKFLGYMPESDMNRLYSGAQLFVFPSIYEGFGMPLLEAMASGTPVIASASSSLPEVAGKEGFLVNPYNVADWQAAISKVLSDKAVQSKMIMQGLKQSENFSWEASARQTLKVFEKFV